MRGYILSGVCVFWLVACGKPSTSSLTEAWNWSNDPQQMDGEFVQEQQYLAHFVDLPLTGKLSRQPWTGDYWPTYRGGIAYRWHGGGKENSKRGYPLVDPFGMDTAMARFLSPAEKWDLYTGRIDFPTTRRERERTKVLTTIPGQRDYDPNVNIPYWEGLCHAWAVAALHFTEPQPVIATVSRGANRGLRIPFASADIKALLTYFLHEHSGATQYLGLRCEFEPGQLERALAEGEISETSYWEKREACLDVNAGAFHLVLANQIGRLDQGFIMDVTKESEVWNHPVYSYRSKILEEQPGASRGAAEGTVAEVLVRTTVRYTIELPNTWRPSQEDSLDGATYVYRLELDKDGMIIGGAWPTDKADRPDFLWKSEVPEFSGIYRQLEELYDLSLRGN